MNILFIASEAVPFAKTGGLADVVGALPRALQKKGHKVKVVLPRYTSINLTEHRLKPAINPLGVWMGDRLEWCSSFHTFYDGIQFFFIESLKYFDRWGFYHDAEMNDYLDNAWRFGFFTQAALQLCKDTNFAPDIVHVHDWQTALAPGFLKIWHWNDPILGRAASVLTIHNIAYQGVYAATAYDYLGLQRGNFHSDSFEDHGKINFLKGGIQFADALNTVSPTFARETLTPEGGHGLAPFLNNRGDDYCGILNGADYSTWNPKTDRMIPANYSINKLDGKAACKEALQRRMLLDVTPDIPLIGIISRLTTQKGLWQLAQVIERLVKDMLVQFVILGAGEKELSGYFGGLPASFQGRIGSFIGYQEELAHWIQAGSDFLLMPSLFEPCGLNQMYAMRYGTLPIVRATGGLEDTVLQYDEQNGNGNGFKYWEPKPEALYYTIGWVVSTFFDRKDHIQKMIKCAMRQDFSWEKSAAQYELLYQRARTNKEKL